jgi:DNA-binding transcriptional ArsR family regulator
MQKLNQRKIMQKAELQLVSDVESAAAMLNPLRLRMLELLDKPNSATGLAKVLDEPRQKVNYHLRALEKAGLVRLVETRRRRNCEERIVVATARSYLVSPEILGKLGATTHQIRDRFSSAYQLAVLTESLTNLAFLRRKAEEAGQKLATLTLQTEIRFATPQKRNQFANEISRALAELTAKYHDDLATDGRTFKFNLTGLPAIHDPELLRERGTLQTKEDAEGEQK